MIACQIEVDFITDSPDYKTLQADTDELAGRGRRVMVHRDHHKGTFKLFIAPEGTLTAGFVVAVEDKS